MAQHMQDSPPEEYQSGSMPEIFQLIDRVGKKLKQLQRRTIQAADLTPPQYFTLSLLWEKDQRPLKELAVLASCSQATMTGIVDTLEKKNLVTREPNPGDRRSLRIKLTGTGLALQDSTPTLEKIFGNCCYGLAPDEIQQLSELLKKLDQSLTV